MRVDAHVAGGAGQALAFAVGDMLFGLGITVLFRHAKVDDVDDVLCFGVGSTDEEVVGLDVAVDQVLLVDGLDAGEHLLGDHDDGLDGEAAPAVVEEVFQTGPQQETCQRAIDVLHGVGGWNEQRRGPGKLTAADQNLIGAVLIAQLRSVALARLELDGDLGVVEEVGTLEDDAEAALADLLAHAVVHTDDVAARGSHDGVKSRKMDSSNSNKKEVRCDGGPGSSSGGRKRMVSRGAAAASLGRPYPPPPPLPPPPTPVNGREVMIESRRWRRVELHCRGCQVERTLDHARPSRVNDPLKPSTASAPSHHHSTEQIPQQPFPSTLTPKPSAKPTMSSTPIPSTIECNKVHGHTIVSEKTIASLPPIPSAMVHSPLMLYRCDRPAFVQKALFPFFSPWESAEWL
nr:hypothetical protein CFP56_23969 [Quercus suber]